MHLSVYSPPFAGLYQYSRSERDLSNAAATASSSSTTGTSSPRSPGSRCRAGYRRALHGRADRQHRRRRADATSPATSSACTLVSGFDYVARYHIWKEPLTVRNRTMTKDLAHKTIVDDSTPARRGLGRLPAGLPQAGENPVPIAHRHGFTEYHGAGGRPPTCSATGAGRATRSRTATRTGSGGSTPRRSGMTSAEPRPVRRRDQMACCRSGRPATRRTRSTSTRCSST